MNKWFIDDENRPDAWPERALYARGEVVVIATDPYEVQHIPDEWIGTTVAVGCVEDGQEIGCSLAMKVGRRPVLLPSEFLAGYEFASKFVEYHNRVASAPGGCESRLSTTPARGKRKSWARRA